MKILITSLLTLMATTAFTLPKLSQNIMVTGPSELALKSALRVARDGGNPVDVAVAYGLTLSVTHPYFGSLGGGGFAMINMDGKPTALDFREMAPSKMHPKYFVEKKDKNASITGGAAVGVPGAPMGFWEMHQKYGKLKWSKLFNEALYYSKSGFPVSSEWYLVTKREHQRFWSEGASHLLINNNVPKPGDILKQKPLYKALKLLRDRGPKGFYEGVVAADIKDSVVQSGGDMTLEDLKNYKAIWRKPLTTNFAGKHIYLMPPPSSGGVIIKTALELVKNKKPEQYGALSLNELHVLSEIMALSFRGRSLLGDPDQHQNPISFLNGDKYIKMLSDNIKLNKTSRLKPLTEKDIPKESNETTHFIVMNKDGQAVSLTITLNGNYGSGVVSKKYGIALNNEIDDFTTRPGEPNMFGLIQGNGNIVNAGKRPLSSMSPSLVLDDKNKTVLAVGAPGGPRIINGVFQTLYRSLVSGFNMEKAIFTPRLHHQFLPRTLYYEKDRFSPLVLNALKKKGHKLEPTYGVAISYGVRINDSGLLEGSGDFRGESFTGGL